jgi:hypothetical protein
MIKAERDMVLETEVEFYNSQKKDWLRHYEGKFALIKGRELLGTYTTWQEAFSDGVQKLGNVPFLIRQVQEKDEIVQFPALAVGAISASSHAINP